MDELLRRLDETLTMTPLPQIRQELQILLTTAYRAGAMDFKKSTDNVMTVLDRAMEQYHDYVAQWETPRQPGEAATEKPRPGAAAASRRSG